MRANHFPPVINWSQTAHWTAGESMFEASKFITSLSDCKMADGVGLRYGNCAPHPEMVERSLRRTALHEATYYFSIPPVLRPAPGLVAQQKAESSPHFWQTCLTWSFLPLPKPVTSMVLSQPGQACFS